MALDNCINDDDLTAFLDGELPEVEVMRVREHVLDCPDCGQVVHAVEALGENLGGNAVLAHSASEHTTVDIRPEEIAPGMRVGRYLVDRELGAGATGIVYLAHDPDLDRHVALKILHHKAEGTTPAQRLVREAQAMAKLSHANVRAVYDVGVIANCFYLALEYIDGITLREWIAEPRSTQEIIGVFVQAGRGLAAAHEVGLIHRDFKPDNVLVNREGVVKVTDLGLAMFLASDEPSAPPATSSTEFFFDQKLTQTGAVVGTPAYMSPEHFRGIVDERSDQFSFCVALFEALAGRRPFAGDNALEVLENARQHKMVEKVRPRWLGKIIERGLRPDAGARHPNMQGLVKALLSRRKRIRVGVFLLAIGATMGGIAFAWPNHATALQEECLAAGDEIRDVWTPPVRAAIASAFATSDVAYKRDTGAIVTKTLDNYAQQWILAKRSSCQNEGLVGTTDKWPQIAQHCLDERLTAFRTTLEILREADKKGLARFAEILSTLPMVEECTSAAHLMSYTWNDDPETNQAWKSGRADLIEAKALTAAGKNDSALKKLRATLAHAETFGIHELRAQVLVQICSVQADEGRLAQAEEACHAAAAAAVAAGKLKFAVLSWGLLSGMLAQDATRFKEAHQWAAYAESALAENAELHPDIELTVAAGLGLLARNEQRYEDAERYYLRALRKGRELYGDENYRVLSVLNNLAVLEADVGKNNESAQHHDESLQIRKRHYGARHPAVAVALLNAAIPLRQHPDTREQASTYLLEALDIANESAPDHKIMHHAIHNGLGMQFLGRDNSKAMRHFEKAIALASEQFGMENPRTAVSMENLALCFTSDEEQSRALEIQNGVLKIRREHYGEMNELTGRSHYNIALVLMRLQRLQEAMEHAHSYRNIARQLQGTAASHLITALGLIGRIHNMNDDWRQAEAPLRQAAELLSEQENTLSPIERGNIYWDLCQALSGAKSSRQEAEKAARASLAAFEESGSEAHIRWPKNWLAEHRSDTHKEKTTNLRN